MILITLRTIILLTEICAKFVTIRKFENINMYLPDLDSTCES